MLFKRLSLTSCAFVILLLLVLLSGCTSVPEEVREEAIKDATVNLRYDVSLGGASVEEVVSSAIKMTGSGFVNATEQSQGKVRECFTVTLTGRTDDGGTVTRSYHGVFTKNGNQWFQDLWGSGEHPHCE